MSEAEIKLACIELALGTNLQRESDLNRATVFAEWVKGDPLRLRALTIASKKEGGFAKVGSDRILATAEAYLDWASPPQAPPAKRGRPKKS